MQEFDFFFLDEDYVFGNDKLDIFKKNPELISAPITDYSLLLGGSCFGRKVYISEEKEEKYLGEWWTSTFTRNSIAIRTVSSYGILNASEYQQRNISARPVISYSKIKNFVTSQKKRCDGILEIEFGEYPQYIVNDKNLERELERLWNNGDTLPELKFTDKAYSFDGTDLTETEFGFNLEQYLEVLYKGNKYVRFTVGDNGNVSILSNEKTYYKNDVCWLKVEPIKWLVDRSSDLAISKNLLFSSVQYCNDISDIGFLSSDIKNYMDTYFCKEILPSNVKTHNVTVSEKDIPNPYGFDFSNVSEEEIIKGCVEANIAVMLHGRSGDGKSARVKELDPDAEILYLINASPDSLGGKSIVYNGEMIDIPPTWYIRLKEKCESEADKIHIVFFDEITNAPPSIQGMAFNIILDKEVNGKWKLPDNARIVAAGNELEESRSAYGMSEPLFNRFAHVYIETKVEDWLSWASTPSETYERLPYKQENIPMKIHPSIYAFIAYKSFKGEEVLRSKFDGIKPNADPRKWELASKVLYETRKPEMLRSLVGEEITREFTMFCRQRVITIEDVLNDNYTEEDLRMDTGEKYNTAVGLSSVSIEHFEKVRDFVKRLGSEICATFETLWARGIEERLEKIQEIKLSERTR